MNKKKKIALELLCDIFPSTYLDKSSQLHINNYEVTAIGQGSRKLNFKIASDSREY